MYIVQNVYTLYRMYTYIVQNVRTHRTGCTHTCTECTHTSYRLYTHIVQNVHIHVHVCIIRYISSVHVHDLSPLQALDGRVERDDSGKEKRFPVLLTAAEKLIARKVVHAFKVS